MIRKAIVLICSLLMLGACTIAGDVLDPPREVRAQCLIAEADPVPQTGLATTAPLSIRKF